MPCMNSFLNQSMESIEEPKFSKECSSTDTGQLCEGQMDSHVWQLMMQEDYRSFSVTVRGLHQYNKYVSGVCYDEVTLWNEPEGDPDEVKETKQDRDSGYSEDADRGSGLDQCPVVVDGQHGTGPMVDKEGEVISTMDQTRMKN